MTRALFLAFVFATLVAPGVEAQFIVSAKAGYFSPTNSGELSDFWKPAPGISASASYRPTARLSVGISGDFVALSFDSEALEAAAGFPEPVPPLRTDGDANQIFRIGPHVGYHIPVPLEILQPYVRAGAGLMSTSSRTRSVTGPGGTATIASNPGRDVSLNIEVGINVPFSDTWFFVGGLAYTYGFTDIEITQRNEATNYTSVHVGLGLRL